MQFVRLRAGAVVICVYMAHGGADAELRIRLTFAHPATGSEADFLFGSTSKGRGAKRKRGPAHVQLGEWHALSTPRCFLAGTSPLQSVKPLRKVVVYLM